MVARRPRVCSEGETSASLLNEMGVREAMIYPHFLEDS